MLGTGSGPSKRAVVDAREFAVAGAAGLRSLSETGWAIVWRSAFLAWIGALGTVSVFGITSTAPPYHPSRVLVKPRAEVDPSWLSELHRSINARVIRVLERQAHVMTIQLPEGLAVEEAVTRYRRSGLVEFAEPDYRVSAATTLPSDPWFQNGTLWGLNNYGQGGGAAGADIDAPVGWDVAHSSSNVIVAIIDSGVRTTHLELSDNLWSDPVAGGHGTNALSGGHEVTDDFGHGTHVAGIIGAIGDNARGVVGVAWRTRIMACKFLDGQGNGFSSDAAACIEYAVGHGAQVINLSWGGPAPSETLSNAIHSAQAAGVLFVAGAGNDGRNIDAQPYYPAALALDNLISVGASTRYDTVWISSGYGAETVDLFAPGHEIYSASNTGDNDYTSLNGTSMATAYVTGALVLLRGQLPDAPYRVVLARLFGGVDQSASYTGRCVTGGRLNLRKALDHPALKLVKDGCAECPPDQQQLPWHLLVQGRGRHSYVLQASSDLNHWDSVQTNLMNASGGWTLAAPDYPAFPRRFYRAIPAP
jgi:subtilisin family serine protease